MQIGKLLSLTGCPACRRVSSCGSGERAASGLQAWSRRVAAVPTLLLGLGLASSLVTPAASAALPPRTIEIGSGGDDGTVHVDAAGAIHVIYGGTYRSGSTPERLGPAETFNDNLPVSGVRIATDGSDQP